MSWQEEEGAGRVPLGMRQSVATGLNKPSYLEHQPPALPTTVLYQG